MGEKETQSNEGVGAVFEKMFNDFSDVIYRLCCYKTSRPSTAEELTQEVFMRLWKALISGQVIEKPKSYIYQITRNLIVDYYRTSKETSLDLLHEKGFDAVSEYASPDTYAEVSIVKEAIDSLDKDYREVTYLRLVEGWAVNEIAEMLGISENLVSVRINRSKQKLKEIFK